jgi:hypothetical protein
LQQVEAVEAARRSDRQASAAGRLRARFAAVESAADGKLAEAKRLAGAKRWEKASEVLQDLEAELSTFQDTELACSSHVRRRPERGQ